MSPHRRRAARLAFLLATLTTCSISLAAGVREPAIGLEFPERLGTLALKGRTQFPKPGDGAATAYEGAGFRGAIYVYDAGIKEIPNGVGSPVIHKHFMETVSALQRASAEGPTKARATPIKGSTLSAFPGCGPQFMWRSDALEINGQTVVSRTYLTGYNQHFVKLRVTHARGDERAAEDFVQDVRRVLGKCA